MESLQAAGRGLIQWLQLASPALDGPLRVITALGSGELYLVLVPLLYWLVRPALAIRLLLVLLVTDLATTALKQLFYQPRPSWLGDVLVLESQATYGFPSGHAGSSVAVWGTLARWVRRWWAWLVAVVVIGLIGLSRLYLGVHYPHDVVGGWLLGLAVLVLLPAAEGRALPWLKGKSPVSLIGLAVAVAVAVIGLGLLVGLAIAGVADPPDWPAIAGGGRALTAYINTAGLLVGTVAGLVGLRRGEWVALSGPWPWRLAGALVGLLGLLLIWRGLALALNPLALQASPLGLALRCLRYAIMGLWVAGLAPWLFARVPGLRKT